MVKHLGFRFLAGVIVGALAACLSAPAAHAGYLSQLEGMQSSSGVLHQFKYEGASAATRQNNTGSANVELLTVAGEGGSGSNTVDPDMVPGSGDEIVTPWSYAAGDVNLIRYEDGFDGPGVSQAYRPQEIMATSTFAAEVLAQRRSGAGLYLPSFTTPSMMTVEGVIKPDLYPETGGAGQGGSLHYVFQTRPGTPRGYYLAQQAPDGSRGVGGTMTAAVGNPFTSFANRPRIVGDYADPEHWYYIAVTYDLSNTAAPAVINSWYSDLTTGGPLIQSQTNYAAPENIGAGLVGATGLGGVGLFVRPATATLPILAQEFFAGWIDNLAIYGDKLTAAQVGRHYRALTIPGVPEPASAVLLAIGSLAVAACRRRAK